jgi:hypothetical protein
MSRSRSHHRDRDRSLLARVFRGALRAAPLAIAVAALGQQAEAAPASMTRDQILNLGKTVVGYSYWWGHGRWRLDGTSHGSCSGAGCPSCTHHATGSGEYGADCSGFVAKAWQVPGPIAVTTDGHPYSTWSFAGSSSYWSPVSRGSALAADAFVYNNGSEGHIWLYEKGDPWGSAWAYECKGCSYGCVHNLRGTGGYSVRRRANIANVVDTDGDGVPDATDSCDTVDNPSQTDTDKDGKGDACDTDDDGDGVLDTKDNCPLAKNADQKDTDKDGKGDVCDTDDDGDGVLDTKDNCPLVSNKNQADTDKDGMGDACDPDIDGDGIANAKDNCPVVKNADQKDTDGDGKGDACDADDDQDGVPDATDNCKTLKNADQADTDGDKIGDACDPDLDGDGVPNATDNCAEDANADQKDTDGDGFGDACDADIDADGLVNDADDCPTVANEDQQDSDEDGLGDVCDDDLDGDGVPNATDNCPTIANADQAGAPGAGNGDACKPSGDPGDPGDVVSDGTTAADGGCGFDGRGTRSAWAGLGILLLGAAASVRRAGKRR